MKRIRAGLWILAAGGWLPAGCGGGGPDATQPGKPEPGAARVAMLNVTAALAEAWRGAQADDWAKAEGEAERAERAFATARGLLLPAQKDAHLKLLAEVSDRRLPELRKAAGLRSRTGFESAWRQMAASCNACHSATRTDFTVAPPGEAGR